IDLLPDVLLGSLDDVQETAVRRHLRGCGPCRREHAELEAGLEIFGRATHTAEPPPDLQEQVLGALDAEWRDVPRAPRPRWLALASAAAVIALLVGTLTLALTAGRRADRLDAQVASLAEDAGEYRAFLAALGGKSVDVATFASAASAAVEGSAIVYHGDEGPSWVVLYVHGIGPVDSAAAFLRGRDGSVEIGSVHLDDDGNVSAWLVSDEDLAGYDTIVITDAEGGVLAEGALG
ncbi:MAG: zf-HC2 domain-containing protein, partial [Actinomycetota bacterium]